MQIWIQSSNHVNSSSGSKRQMAVPEIKLRPCFKKMPHCGAPELQRLVSKKFECVVVPFLSLAVTENGLWLQTNCDICGFKVQASLNRVHNSDIESLYKYIYQKPNRAVWVEVLLWMNWMWVVPLGSGGCLSTWYWAAWPQSNPTSIKGLETLKLQTEIFRSGFSSLKILWAFWGLSLVVSEFKF